MKQCCFRNKDKWSVYVLQMFYNSTTPGLVISKGDVLVSIEFVTQLLLVYSMDCTLTAHQKPKVIHQGHCPCHETKQNKQTIFKGQNPKSRTKPIKYYNMLHYPLRKTVYIYQWPKNHSPKHNVIHQTPNSNHQVPNTIHQGPKFVLQRPKITHKGIKKTHEKADTKMTKSATKRQRK